MDANDECRSCREPRTRFTKRGLNEKAVNRLDVEKSQSHVRHRNEIRLQAGRAFHKFIFDSRSALGMDSGADA
jgi:hypothetical protein